MWTGGHFWWAQGIWMVNSKPNLHERETPQWERRERKGSFKCKRSNTGHQQARVVSFAWGGRGRGRGRILVGGSLSHIAHHVSGRGLRKLLWHERLWLLARAPHHPCILLLGSALWGSPSGGSCGAGTIATSTVLCSAIATRAIGSCSIAPLSVTILALCCPKSGIWAPVGTAIGLVGSVGITVTTLTVSEATWVSPALFHSPEPPVTLFLVHQVRVVYWTARSVTRTASWRWIRLRFSTVNKS